MREDPRALDVPEEAVAQTGPEVRAGYQAGNVGDDEARVPQLDHPEMRAALGEIAQFWVDRLAAADVDPRLLIYQVDASLYLGNFAEARAGAERALAEGSELDDWFLEKLGEIGRQERLQQLRARKRDAP